MEQLSRDRLPEPSSANGAGALNVVGPQVRDVRIEQGLTQEEHAAKCSVIGWDLSRSTLAKIESCCRQVTDEEVVFLADALKVRIEKLYPTS